MLLFLMLLTFFDIMGIIAPKNTVVPKTKTKVVLKIIEFFIESPVFILIAKPKAIAPLIQPANEIIFFSAGTKGLEETKLVIPVRM